ncbi:uncharacterized protein PV09_05018 [Verruconis gallopava]|uniref:SMP-30/Gluconolactonase/LRE-like region domain-containing protein n=1 Tax=Verruconis gallopava TaxID=253628 RepID=A0A0D2AAS7_9PEZI|nr:uncharacterized protein PV09_05018 [Verruconis gallopava]KIW03705.1 hypothetical protein PV09_05018 [Verruconis gallopava]
MDWEGLSNAFYSQFGPIASAVSDTVDKALSQLAQWTAEGSSFRLQPHNGSPFTGIAQTTPSQVKMASVTTVDLLRLATSLPYAGQISSFNAGMANLTFQLFDSSFASILGPNASWRMIANESYQAFHEAGVYHQDTKSLYIASNWANDFSNPINVSILNLEDYSLSSERYEGLASPNGGTTYVPPGTTEKPQLIFCDEGDFEVASALTIVDPVAKTTKQVVNNFFGRNFSSLNDVRQHYETGDLWFTDAQYGYLQSFRPSPGIPNQIYRFEPTTGNLQAVADGFVQSNGLEFSPDFKTLYVSDTGAQLVELGQNFTRPATIYAFDVVDQKYLQNRRIFAYVDSGVPDGIHVDTNGNVFSGCGDGVQVWNPEGRLLGKIRVEKGSANFAFVPEGMIIFNEYRLFLVTMAARGRELARDFGA